MSIEPGLFKIPDISKYVPDICSPKDRNENVQGCIVCYSHKVETTQMFNSGI